MAETKTSPVVDIGAKTYVHELDTTGLPADAVIVLTTEVSDDAGKTWRAHGFVSVRKSDMNPADRFVGAGVAFVSERGNRNPDFMVRATAEVIGAPSAVLVITERLPKVL